MKMNDSDENRQKTRETGYLKLDSAITVVKQRPTNDALKNTSMSMHCRNAKKQNYIFTILNK